MIFKISLHKFQKQFFHFFIFSAILHSPLIHAIGAPLYYPSEFLQIVEQRPLTKNNIDIKNAIFKVLNKIHLKQKNLPDKLVDICPPTETCTQQKADLSYTDARKKMFGQLFLQKTIDQKYFVKDVYCNKVIDETSGAGENKIPNPSLVNCEHTWPQSKFTKTYPENMQKTDLHHLFPTMSKANSTRSNHPFSEVDGRPTNSDCTDSFIGPSRFDSTITAFEPPNEHKGNVARAIFYFSVRYNTPMHTVQIEFLKKWNREDPVDIDEQNRNTQIEILQGNRNPFIDFPHLIENI